MKTYLVVVIWKDGRSNRMKVPGDNYSDAASRCYWLTESSEHIMKVELIEISAPEVKGMDRPAIYRSMEQLESFLVK